MSLVPGIFELECKHWANNPYVLCIVYLRLLGLDADNAGHHLLMKIKKKCPLGGGDFGGGGEGGGKGEGSFWGEESIEKGSTRTLFQKKGKDT